jgi:UDP-glucose 4-epimerase
MGNILVVTGGAGFIGSNLTRELLSLNHDVTILDDFSAGSTKNLKDLDVEIIHDSILNISALRKAVAKVDEIVHLAAIGSVPRSILDPESTYRVNVEGTINILEMARIYDKGVIFASSSSVYGDSLEMPRKESNVVMPKSPYAASKLAGESFVNAYNTTFGMKTNAFRFFNVYGKNQSSNHAYAAVIPNFITAALSKKPLVVEGDGQQIRDFTYVGDVVRIIVKSLNSNFSCNSPINIGSGNKSTIMDLIAHLEVALGENLRINFAPAREGDVRESYASIDKLESTFNSLDFTPITSGLSKTLEWFRSELPTP